MAKYKPNLTDPTSHIHPDPSVRTIVVGLTCPYCKRLIPSDGGHIYRCVCCRTLMCITCMHTCPECKNPNCSGIGRGNICKDCYQELKQDRLFCRHCNTKFVPPQHWRDAWRHEK